MTERAWVCEFINGKHKFKLKGGTDGYLFGDYIYQCEVCGIGAAVDRLYFRLALMGVKTGV